ncbi:hypothetical protein RIF29_40154 [Crotalaria pallida]|uniref:Uncharacterized protein n=1 Tax=Crotalaria pallida TaxID=3830 RepID=A0AAN9E348_CROPI
MHQVSPQTKIKQLYLITPLNNNEFSYALVKYLIVQQLSSTSAASSVAPERTSAPSSVAPVQHQACNTKSQPRSLQLATAGN